MNSSAKIIAVVALLAQAASHSPAAAAGSAHIELFTQAALAEEESASFALGGTVPWSWQRRYSFGVVTGYLEGVLASWMVAERAGRDNRRATQIGLTPVLRWQPPTMNGRLYVDAGIGANVITPLYRSGSKRFSTAFNFGDLLAIGMELGASRRFAISLGVQHFSNAGLKHPNPGVNFLQLRLSSALMDLP